MGVVIRHVSQAQGETDPLRIDSYRSGKRGRPMLKQTAAQMVRERMARTGGKCDDLEAGWCERWRDDRHHHRLFYESRLEVGGEAVMVVVGVVVRVRVETLVQLRRGGEQSDDEDLRESKPHQGREYALPPELTGPQ